MFSFAKVAVVASLATAILAIPLAARQEATCKPNFEGNAVNVFRINSADPTGPKPIFEWSSQDGDRSHIDLVNVAKEALVTGDFLVEFTGAPANSYHIKLVADTDRNLAAAVATDGHLVFEEAASDGSQDFSIDCDVCVSEIGLGNNCAISHPTTGLCVTAPGDAVEGRLTMTPCDKANTAQFFGLVKALSPEDVVTIVPGPQA